MKTELRRAFQRRLRAVALLFTLAFGVPSAFRAQERPFEFLVAGDSLVWGQGLNENEKFYSLTADWLRQNAIGSGRTLNLKVKAHSGSTLKFHPDEAAKYEKLGRSETYYFKPEVNVGFPSIYKQIETASAEYRAEGKTADLIMLGGGITDITTSKVFDPKGDDTILRDDVTLYLRDHLYDVLELAAERNPEAKIVVIGYFPVITTNSNSGKLLNAWLEVLSFPRAFKFVANNPFVRPLFFNKLRKRAIERSRIWLEESDLRMKEAVAKLNQKLGRERVFFVPSPLSDEHAAEAPKTKLFRMGKGGFVTDPIARQRSTDCRAALPKLKTESGIDYPVRLCEVAALGHPDKTGARAYADAIIQKLKTLW